MLMKMSKPYRINLSIDKKGYDITITPHKDEGFDLDIKTPHPMSGDEFQALRKYMEDEGYFEEASQYYS